jgi:hypothetical protein
LFQPELGSQTSILISESLDGVKVACTRQNAGKPLKSAIFTRNGPGAAGGMKAPAPTLSADVIVTWGRLRRERFSHVDPPVGAASSEAAGISSDIISDLVIENFVMDRLLNVSSSAIIYLTRFWLLAGMLF